MNRDSLETVEVEISEGIGWIYFNRPEKRNSMSPQLHEEMDFLLADLEADNDVKVVVISGRGESWCAGQDLQKYFRDGVDNPSEAKRIREISERWRSHRLQGYDKPTIAMVNGYCFGGGFTQLISCDFAIAAEEATFGVSEVNWGIIPAGIVGKALVDTIPFRDALFYAATGRTFNGKQAAEMRLVNLAVPLERLKEETTILAKELMEKNPHTLKAIKQCMRQVRNMNYHQAFDYLAAKLTESKFNDRSSGREQAMKQFLDDKTYRPGLGAYKADAE